MQTNYSLTDISILHRAFKLYCPTIFSKFISCAMEMDLSCSIALVKLAIKCTLWDKAIELVWGESERRKKSDAFALRRWIRGRCGIGGRNNAVEWRDGGIPRYIFTQELIKLYNLLVSSMVDILILVGNVRVSKGLFPKGDEFSQQVLKI